MRRRRYQIAYVSEFGLFMDKYLAEHPDVADDRQVGRSMYWDKKVTAAEIDSAQRDNVPIDSYYYFANF